MISTDLSFNLLEDISMVDFNTLDVNLLVATFLKETF